IEPEPPSAPSPPPARATVARPEAARTRSSSWPPPGTLLFWGYVRGDTIAAGGYLPGATAARTIDAAGQVVAPGFIDIHTHARRGIFDVPTAENYIRQGVTTLIEGNDGSSPIPLGPFLEKVAARRTSVNFGSFVGQGSVRREVIGLVNRRATPEEIEKMKQIVRQAMLDGALGISTGLFYIPGNYTPTEEVIELAKVAGAMGGMHISHMRNEAEGLLASVRETIAIGEQGHLPTQITHHKVIGPPNWGQSVETLKLVEEARARGVDVTIDQYPYTASSTGLSALIPQWAQEGGDEMMRKRFQDPATRARIKPGIVAKIRLDRGGGNPKNVALANCGFDLSLNGKSLAQVADERGLQPTPENAADVAMDLLMQGNCQTVYHAIDEADVERIMQYPWTMIGSDGEVPIFGKGVLHPRSYGTFTRVLGVYVRERHILTLEDAIRKMSSLPAQRLKLFDRGLLRPGMKADLVIFDPDTVADRAVFGNPHQYAVGFSHVMVNGELIIDGGRVTDRRPGRVLYGPARTH
ncbi:MAG TPA: D-aminoacylase, partial [Bryobacterales bacterium]|nr:D-aminoacylase [Bryobacterales bacterium]